MVPSHSTSAPTKPAAAVWPRWAILAALLVFWGLPLNPRPVPFQMALNDIHPGIVLMNPELRHTISAYFVPPFLDFITAHHARAIGQVPDYAGQRVTVYQLDP
jgi:hypothetical protein